MNFLLILVLVCLAALGFLYHRTLLLQGELSDLKSLTTGAVTLDELEHTIVPAVERLSAETAALRRNMALLAAGERPQQDLEELEELEEPEAQEPEDHQQLREHDQLQALITSVAGMFGTLAPARVVVAPTRVAVEAPTRVAIEAPLAEVEELEDEEAEAPTRTT